MSKAPELPIDNLYISVTHLIKFKKVYILKYCIVTSLRRVVKKRIYLPDTDNA